MRFLPILIPTLCLLCLPIHGETPRTEIDATRGILRDSGITGGKTATIPFEENLFYGYIVKVKINGQPVSLLLDTGSSVTALTIQAAERIGLTLGEFDSGRDAFGNQVGLRRARIGRLTMGAAWVDGETVVISDMPEEMRRNIDGILGVASLADWDVRIDPVGKIMTLYPPGESDALKGETVVPLTCSPQSLDIKTNNPKQFRPMPLRVPIKVGKKTLQLTPDTGYGGMLSLSEKSMEDTYPGLLRRAPLCKSLAMSLSGLALDKDIEIPEVTFGSDTLKKVSAHISASPQNMPGQIGREWLCHYVMTFRFTKGELRLNTILPFEETTPFSRIGISFFSDFKILQIDAGGPGEKAGLLIGDTILEIEGIPMKTMKTDEQYAIRRRPPGTKIKIRYQRGTGAPQETILELEKQ